MALFVKITDEEVKRESNVVGLDHPKTHTNIHCTPFRTEISHSVREWVRSGRK